MTPCGIISRSNFGRFAASAILACAAVTAGCSAGPGPIGLELRSRTSFELDWQRYTRVRNSKAFAFAGDPAGISVTGIAYGMPSRLDAETVALDYCEEQRVARRLLDPCVIFAVNDTIVAQVDEAPAPSLSRSDS